MNYYQSKVRKLTGSNYAEIYPQAFEIYKAIRRRTKRKPNVRSSYFKKQKIFLDYFWEHLHQKNLGDKARRLKYYSCALDLIKNSKVTPTSKENPNKRYEVLHRFTGRTSDGDLFYVQIKEDKKTNQKYFISAFPEEYKE